MIQVIRFIGVLNVAVWLGGAVFFTFGVAPTFFSGEVKQTGLHVFWPGVMAQLVLERYFCLYYICGTIAVAHQLAEWVYLGRPLQRLTLGVLMGLLLVGGLGGLWLQPKLKRLHLLKYSMSEQYKPASVSNADRSVAAKSFGAWHGVSQAINLIGLIGLVVYFWRVTHQIDGPRFVSATKFRS